MLPLSHTHPLTSPCCEMVKEDAFPQDTDWQATSSVSEGKRSVMHINYICMHVYYICTCTFTLYVGMYYYICSCMAVWLYDCMTAWLYGHTYVYTTLFTICWYIVCVLLHMFLYMCMAVWLYDCMTVWTYDNISYNSMATWLYECTYCIHSIQVCTYIHMYMNNVVLNECTH